MPFVLFRTYYSICYTCFLRLFADHHGDKRVPAAVFNDQHFSQRYFLIFGVFRCKCPLAGRRFGEAFDFGSSSHHPSLLLGFKMPGYLDSISVCLQSHCHISIIFGSHFDHPLFDINLNFIYFQKLAFGSSWFGHWTPPAFDLCRWYLRRSGILVSKMKVLTEYLIERSVIMAGLFVKFRLWYIKPRNG